VAANRLAAEGPARDIARAHELVIDVAPDAAGPVAASLTRECILRVGIAVVLAHNFPSKGRADPAPGSRRPTTARPAPAATSIGRLPPNRHYSSPTRSRLPSCKFFIFCAKSRETFLLSKAAGEGLPLALYKDALRRDCRLFEVPVAEMVKRCAQEQALPITEENAPIFERFEGFLQFSAGLPNPKIAMKIRMLMRRLVVHGSRIGGVVGL
jgi:hypothetical protein